MKHLLPFTFFCFLSLNCVFAVQEQKNDRVIAKKELHRVSAVTKANNKQASAKKHTIASKKSEHAIILRRLQGEIGHAIIKIDHREMIDRRKRIAGNY